MNVGDRVVVYPWGGCMKCWACKQDSHYCIDTKGHKYGIWQAGGYVEPYLLHKCMSSVFYMLHVYTAE